MSANSERLDQFEEGNATGGHAGEVEAIRRPTVSPSSPRMTARRFPALRGHRGGDRPLTPCFDQPIEPMTLGNMRELGVRSLFKDLWQDRSA
jgi:hypothetical protein